MNTLWAVMDVLSTIVYVCRLSSGLDVCTVTVIGTVVCPHYKHSYQATEM